MPSPGAAYSVSKAGVWMLTKCLAQELARHGVRVNAIGPGFIETLLTAALRSDTGRSRWAMGLTPLSRYGTPEEVASTALFLASDEAAFFTGEIPRHVIFVDEFPMTSSGKIQKAKLREEALRQLPLSDEPR